MPPIVKKELLRLIVLMEEMREASENSNWQDLSRLDSERRSLIKYDPSIYKQENQSASSLTEAGTDISHNTLNKSADADEEYESLVQQVLEMDRQIIEIVQLARQNLLDENRELSAQVKAKELYAQTSSFT